MGWTGSSFDPCCVRCYPVTHANPEQPLLHALWGVRARRKPPIIKLVCPCDTTSGQWNSSLSPHTFILGCFANGKVVQYPNTFHSSLDANTAKGCARLNPRWAQEAIRPPIKTDVLKGMICCDFFQPRQPNLNQAYTPEFATCLTNWHPHSHKNVWPFKVSDAKLFGRSFSVVADTCWCLYHQWKSWLW